MMLHEDAPALETSDIQGLLVAGYRRLRAARYLLLRVEDSVMVKTWLADLAARITNASAPVTTTAVNVAFTYAGLEALGLPPRLSGGFPAEFVEGMVTAHRSRMLGDVGRSAPMNWLWGGDQANPVHILLMLFATDPPALSRLHTEVAGSLASTGLRQVAQLETSDLGDQEHFGFRDGVSQPAIEGWRRPAPWRNSIKAGEFVLGYPNEYGSHAPRPLLEKTADPDGVLARDCEGSGAADLGRNGTYLVFRQLRQDVAAFWSFAYQNASEAGRGSPDALAAKMVGRWPSGAPLVRAPDQDDPSLGHLNDFAYGLEDPAGERCPIGAHIRRANPRDSLDPAPGTDRAIQLVKRHRILEGVGSMDRASVPPLRGRSLPRSTTDRIAVFTSSASTPTW